VTIKNQNMIPEGLLIEDGAFIGPHVSFTNDLHPRSPRMPQAAKRYDDHRWLLRCVIGRGATLGAGAIILPGVSIGEYAMVGAGAVVSRDVLPYAVVLGNPARQVGFACQCGQPLQIAEETGSCSHCGLTYVRSERTIEPAQAPARPLAA
jgi:acetyltransferase-like isoleucine patch superfamily enzyme